MIEVVTIANKLPEATFYTWQQFHDSLHRYGCKALMLGYGEPWGGLMTKPRKLRDWLRKRETKADVLAVCDSWDTVWQKSPAKMEKEFLEVGIDMMIGSERSCFPDHTLAKHHPDCASSFKYVNTGLILAKPGPLLEFLEDMNLDAIPDDGQDPDNFHPNDQNYVMLEFLKGGHNAMLDSQTRFVANLCGVKKEEVEWGDGFVRINETGNIPYLLHFNGGAKTDGLRELVLKSLKFQTV